VLVYVNGDFVPRNEARVSVFDSGFVLGDGVWEGLRLVNGRIISLQAHLDRLFEGARSIALDIGLTRAQVEQALRDTLARNGMTDGAHLRLMVTRGVKKHRQPGPALRHRRRPPSSSSPNTRRPSPRARRAA
jgi:branched-chain amino acid aminotransferase